mgnify:CR=1 FL=1
MNIGVSVITTSIFITQFGSFGIGIAIGVGTFLLLVFGEIIPKTLSLQFPQTYAVSAAYPLRLFALVVQPIQSVHTSIAEKFISFIGFTLSKDKKTAIVRLRFVLLKYVKKFLFYFFQCIINQCFNINPSTVNF